MLCQSAKKCKLGRFMVIRGQLHMLTLMSSLHIHSTINPNWTSITCKRLLKLKKLTTCLMIRGQEDFVYILTVVVGMRADACYMHVTDDVH